MRFRCLDTFEGYKKPLPCTKHETILLAPTAQQAQGKRANADAWSSQVLGDR